MFAPTFDGPSLKKEAEQFKIKDVKLGSSEVNTFAIPHWVLLVDGEKSATFL